MSFVDDLLAAAKEFPQVKRLYISTWEIKTDPLDARDIPPKEPSYPKDTGWPAAWAIARKARVSGGCGNHGQHQISVGHQGQAAAFPPEYTAWLSKKAITEGAHMDAQWALQDAIAHAEAEAKRRFLETDEAKQLQQAIDQREQEVNAMYAEQVPAPGWLNGAWYEVAS